MGSCKKIGGKKAGTKTKKTSQLMPAEPRTIATLNITLEYGPCDLEKYENLSRIIEVDSSKSLYDLGAAINNAFKFNFDHAFAFYEHPDEGGRAFELFADNPEEFDYDLSDREVKPEGVSKTKINSIFKEVGKRMQYHFDYGDDWVFLVTLMKQAESTSKTKYPRIVESVGKAPKQYGQ